MEPVLVTKREQSKEVHMLVLSRKTGQGVDGTITVEGLKKLLAKAEASASKSVALSVTVVRQHGIRVRLGFEFPDEVHLVRDELKRAA
jgi:sRNA-binding carbon storage regulator CsrA